MLRRYDAVDCSSCGYIYFSLWVVVPQFTYLIVGLKSNPCLCVVFGNARIIYILFTNQRGLTSTPSSVLISLPRLGCLMATFTVYLMALLLAAGFVFLPLVV